MKPYKIIIGVGVSVFLITLLILSSVPPLEKEGIVMDINFSDILVSAISGVIFSVGTTIFIYFKFLRHIQEETYNKIDEILNDRLNFEKINHNAIQTNLNPNNKCLSGEHSKIINKLNDIDKSLYCQNISEEEQYNCLKRNQEDILKYLKVIKSQNEEIIKNKTLISSEND